MKKTALILAALVAGASLSAQAPEPVAAPTPSYTVTMDFPYASKYVFRGVELAQGSLQPSIKVVAGAAYSGIWTNQPVTSNVDNEFDFYAGYNFKLSEKWTLDVGATYYYYPELDTSSGLDNATFEGYVGLNGSLGSVTTGTYAFYDFTLKAFTIQETLGYSIPMDGSTSLNLSATLGHVSPDAGSGYTYYSFGAAVPYKLNDTATVTVGLNYADHDISGLDGSHFWFNVGLTATF